jgi:hypothetical protein
MSKADDYRSKAKNCERLADKAKDPDAKQMLQDVARDWHRMHRRDDLSIIFASQPRNEFFKPCSQFEGPFRVTHYYPSF